MAGHSYESALPISSAFCRAVRTSPAKRPNCLPASLTFLASVSMLPLPLEPGSFTPSTLRLRPSAVRPSTTPPSTPAAAPTIAVATGAATVFTALPTDCAALPAVSAALPAPCLTASVAPLDVDRADDAVRFAPERARPLLDAVRDRVRALDARLPELFVAPLLFVRLLPFEPDDARLVAPLLEPDDRLDELRFAVLEPLLRLAVAISLPPNSKSNPFEELPLCSRYPVLCTDTRAMPMCVRRAAAARGAGARARACSRSGTAHPRSCAGGRRGTRPSRRVATSPRRGSSG